MESAEPCSQFFVPRQEFEMPRHQNHATFTTPRSPVDYYCYYYKSTCCGSLIKYKFVRII